MKKILLDDEQRKRIINKVRPDKNDYFSYQNLNLYSGVYDEETDCVLTLAYFLTEEIKRVGDDFNDEVYILLIGRHEFTVMCKAYFNGTRGLKSPCPTVVSDEKLLDMIEFYHCSGLESNDKYGIPKEPENFTENYLNEHYFNKKDEKEKKGKKPQTTARRTAKLILGYAIGCVVWLVYFYFKRHLS